MNHLEEFVARPVQALPLVEQDGWRLKRYAILAEGRAFDAAVAEAASREALRRLPAASALSDADGNHGVGLQIVHFAQVAVVSPVFYWQWGSVLARIDQLRAQWAEPEVFETGVAEVVGCIWEMEVVAFEMDLWKRTMLGADGAPEDRLARYLGTHLGE